MPGKIGNHHCYEIKHTKMLPMEVWGDWIPGFLHAKRLLYHWTTPPFTLLLFCGAHTNLFLPHEGFCYIFSDRNNCEFLASEDINLQSVHQLFFKIPACGASFCIVDNRIQKLKISIDEFFIHHYWRKGCKMNLK